MNDAFDVLHARLVLEASKCLTTGGLVTPDYVYHYCPVGACHGILTTRCIFASSAFCMNDSTEIRYGMDLIKSIARDYIDAKQVDRSFASHHETGEYAMLDMLERTCVTSFCADPDLLSQWRAYGKNGDGYAIGFSGPSITQAGHAQKFTLRPVVYGREKQESALRSFFELAVQLSESDASTLMVDGGLIINVAVLFLGLCFKNEGFAEEKEWRLIATQPLGGIKYRPGRWGFVPYVEVAFAQDSVKEIWQGPTLDQSLTRRTLKAYLDANYGIGNVQLHTSKIPLRGV